MPPSRLPASAANAAMPACTAGMYAAYALAPERAGDGWSEALAVLAVVQIPVAVLAAVAADFMYLEGAFRRRALLFAGVVAVLAVASLLGYLIWHSYRAAIVGWAVAMQLVIVMVAGPEPALAKARISAVGLDAVNLVVMTPFAGLIAIGAVFAAEAALDWRNPFDLSAIAWIAVAYFVARAWSAVYVFTDAFDQRRKGFFVRKWIETLLKPTPKESQY